MHKKILENELEGFGIRLNKVPPNIHFKRKEKGGINLQIMVSNVLRIGSVLSVRIIHILNLFLVKQ